MAGHQARAALLIAGAPAAGPTATPARAPNPLHAVLWTVFLGCPFQELSLCLGCLLSLIVLGGRGTPLGLCNLGRTWALPTPLCLCAFCLLGGPWPMAEGLSPPLDSQVPARPPQPCRVAWLPPPLEPPSLQQEALLCTSPQAQLCLTASGDHSPAEASHLFVILIHP